MRRPVALRRRRRPVLERRADGSQAWRTVEVSGPAEWRERRDSTAADLLWCCISDHPSENLVRHYVIVEPERDMLGGPYLRFRLTDNFAAARRNVRCRHRSQGG